MWKRTGTTTALALSIFALTACAPVADDAQPTTTPTASAPSPSPTTEAPKPLAIPEASSDEVGRFVFSRPAGVPNGSYTLSNVVESDRDYLITAACTSADDDLVVAYRVTETVADAPEIYRSALTCNGALDRSTVPLGVDGGVQISYLDLTDAEEAYVIVSPVD